jgi:hypothetical protein
MAASDIEGLRMSISTDGVVSVALRELDRKRMKLRGRKANPGAVAAVAVLGSFLCGCTSLASGADTEEQLVPPDPQWACLDGAPSSLPLLDPVPKNIAFALPISDYRIVPPVPVPGLTVQACQIQDYDCATSVGLVLSPMDSEVMLYGTTYSVPVYPIVMPYAIDAFIRITAPNYLQTEYYLGGPLLGARTDLIQDGTHVVVSLPVTPILAADADNLAQAVHITRKPNDAIVAMRTLDCMDQPAAGVTLSLSVDGTPFTFLTGQPSFAANLPTDATGLAGFANIAVPSGDNSFTNVTVEGTAPNGKPYGRVNITVRAGQLTQGDIRPDIGLFGF